MKSCEHELAPIALFLYNRPIHARQTIDALKNNKLAAQSDLYVFCDGPKSGSEAKVQEVRDIANSIVGFKSVTVYLREVNAGLADSIIEGVTSLSEIYGRVIVLEDDLITSEDFLTFMNNALNTYKHDHAVFHVSGATYPVLSDGFESSYFLSIPLCWGWATWDRSWQYFKRDLHLNKNLKGKLKRKMDFDGMHPFSSQLDENATGKIKTWFIYWYATLLINRGLALFPRNSLVVNVGFDGTGANCGTEQEYISEHSKLDYDFTKRLDVMESAAAYRAHVKFFKNTRPSWARRNYRNLRRILQKYVR